LPAAVAGCAPANVIVAGIVPVEREEDRSHGTQRRDRERVVVEGLDGIPFGPTSRNVALGGLVSRYSF